MQFLNGKTIPRRTFLRGMGATLALPYLDAMTPAFSRFGGAKSAAASDGTRVIFIEQVHGAAGSNAFGASKNLWAPAGVGKNFELVGDNALTGLDPWRKYLTIVSNTDVRMAEAFAPPEIGGDHFRSSATFLTQSHPKQTQGSDLYVGTSIDQMIARRIGQDTAMPSLQLCIENLDQAGGCDYNYGCAYTDTISWASPSEPLPMIRNPRSAFDLLFGAGTNNADRISRRKANQSILDWISGEVSGLKRQLGPSDRERLDKYVTDIRELERRIQAVEAHNSSGEVRELPEAPIGVPDSFEEHMKLMFDIQVLAMQADLTRTATFMIGREGSQRTYEEIGIPEAHHPLTHHRGNKEFIEKVTQINTFHAQQLAYFLGKLKSTKEGDGSLLDHSMVVYGSGIADGSSHSHVNLPILIAGRGNGALESGRYLKYPDGTPTTNLWLTLLDRMGVHPESVGDSTGRLEHLTSL